MDGVSDDGSIVVGEGRIASGTSNAAHGVSSDGTFVVGGNDPPFSFVRGFRWSIAGGLEDLGYLSGGAASEMYAISADGSVAVGSSNSGVIPAPELDQAVRWTAATGMQSLGDLPGGLTTSRANAISDDGSIIVGGGTSGSGTEAFRWTAAGGMVGLGDLPGGTFNSSANAITPDGTVIAGYGFSTLGGELAIWTESGVHAPGVAQNPLAISADGSVIVGIAFLPVSLVSAVRWTATTGMVYLGDLPADVSWSEAHDVSGDGSLVVGLGRGANGAEAFLWDAANGMRPLKTVLEGLGLDLTGWHLTSAGAISTDGSTIVGYGRNPQGQTEGWAAAIPEPAHDLMLAAGVLALALLRRRRFTSGSPADR